MKNILIASLLLVILMTSAGSAFSQDTGREEKVRKSFENRIQTYLLTSIVPDKNAVPPILKYNRDSSYNFFQNNYPDLLPLFSTNQVNNLYGIKKYRGKVQAYVGFPSYLQFRYGGDGRDEEIALRHIEKLNGIFKYFDIPKNVSIVTDEKHANLFVLPVNKNTFLFLKPFLSHSYSKSNFENVLVDIKNTFSNGILYPINDSGLEGISFINKDNEVILSYCPVNMDEDADKISDAIYLCLIQSQGLPGFQKILPIERTENIKPWGNLLSRLIQDCPDLENGKSFFDIEFNKVFTNCLTDEDYKNADNLFE
jgi:hypothetical protein